MLTAIPEITGAFWCRANLPQKVELAELTVIYLSIYLLINVSAVSRSIKLNQKLTHAPY